MHKDTNNKKKEAKADPTRCMNPYEWKLECMSLTTTSAELRMYVEGDGTLHCHLVVTYPAIEAVFWFKIRLAPLPDEVFALATVGLDNVFSDIVIARIGMAVAAEAVEETAPRSARLAVVSDARPEAPEPYAAVGAVLLMFAKARVLRVGLAGIPDAWEALASDAVVLAARSDACDALPASLDMLELDVAKAPTRVGFAIPVDPDNAEEADNAAEEAKEDAAVVAEELAAVLAEGRVRTERAAELEGTPFALLKKELRRASVRGFAAIAAAEGTEWAGVAVFVVLALVLVEELSTPKEGMDGAL